MMTGIKAQRLTRAQRFAVLLFVYSIVLIAATLLAYGLRFDFVVPIEHQLHIRAIWIWIWPMKIAVLALTGQFSSLLSFFSIPDLKKLALGLGVVTAGILVLWNLNDVIHTMSRGAIILDGMASFLGVSIARLAFRLVRQGSNNEHGRKKTVVAIVGAGELGATLARELQSKMDMAPVAFFDNDLGKKGAQIHGIPVLGDISVLQEGNALAIEEIIIAQPQVSGSQIKKILDILRELKIRCRTIPSLSQLAQGQVVSALRPIDISDVLGREPIQLADDRAAEFYSEKIIMITGAGGSIGSELCRQLVKFDCRRIILVDRSESALFQIVSELRGGRAIVPRLVDISVEDEVQILLNKFTPDIVFHAAAYKHVGLLEEHRATAFKNNVLATHYIASASKKHGVKKFILVSTDKAVCPKSIMGVTKKLAEDVLGDHAKNPNRTSFITVRFGNVLGSSGSVVPIFQKQIEEGGPVTVRGEHTSRYFMSIPEASELVLVGATIGGNGDHFILDMGKPVRIAELAEQMIRLHGKVSGESIEIKFEDLRVGEKEHELLYSNKEAVSSTAHPKIMRLRKQSEKNIGKIAWGSISDEEIVKLAKMDEDEVAGFFESYK